jgi:serine-threonine kinase receptor-associated protein
LIASGGHEKRLRLFDLTKGNVSTDIGQHEGTIKSVVFDRNDPSDSILISSGDDRKVIWWDTRTTDRIAEYTTDTMITSMEQSIDHSVVSVTAGKKVFIFDSLTYSSLFQS